MMGQGAILLATKMLIHKKKRLAISLGAVSFAVLVMFMEQGFFHGVAETQARMLAKYNADLVMMDLRRTDLGKYLMNFDRARMYQALAVPGVRDAFPVYMTRADLKNLQTGVTRGIQVFAFPPDRRPFNIDWSKSYNDLLKIPGMVLFDKKSRKNIYGTIRLHERIKLDGKYRWIAGYFELGPNFLFDGAVLMSERTWLEGKPAKEAEKISYAFIKAKPGTDIEQLRKRILNALPRDVLVLTPEELSRNEVMFTIKRAPIGAVFGVGMIVGFVIGVMICYQILYNEVTDHIPQYTTLRAIGFADRFLLGAVIRESVLLAVLGFIPGFLLSFVLYRVIEGGTGILMRHSFLRAATIFALAVIMCVISGVLAARKALASDPADLYSSRW